jgi:hypothetical protein
LNVNLRGFDPGGSPVEPGAMRGSLGAIGVPAQRIPAGEAAQIGLYRSLMARRRVLLVLDNARSAEQVRPLLPGARRPVGPYGSCRPSADALPDTPPPPKRPWTGSMRRRTRLPGCSSPLPVFSFGIDVETRLPAPTYP